MPHHNFSSQKGDLIVTYHVEMPKTLTEDQKNGFRKLFS